MFIKKWHNGYGRHSLNVKIASVFLLFVFICLTLFDILLSREFRSVLVQEAQSSMENNLENLSSNLELLLSSVEQQTTTLSLNRDIIKFVSAPARPGSIEYLRTNNNAKELLKDSLYSHDILKSVYLVSVKESTFLRTDIRRTYAAEEIMDQDWFASLQGIELNQYVYLSRDTLTEQEPEDFLSYVAPVRDRYNRILGYIMANIGYHSIASYCNNNRIGVNGGIYVYGQNGLIYSSSVDENTTDPSQLLSTAQMFQENEIKPRVIGAHLYVCKWSKTLNWLYVAKIPMDEVLEPSQRITRWAVLMLFAFSLPIVITGSVLLSRIIFSPVRTLLSAIDELGSGEPVKIRQKRQDEFNEVFQAFNGMVDRLYFSMEKLARQETLTKELRIKNLQAQISPHFLYNTLDAIHWAARDHDVDAVCQMTFLLSDYFRKNLSDGKEWVAVSEAAEMIRSYLEIQSLRFMDGFSYTLFLDPSVAELHVPKDIFQPIVENALYHGIERSDIEGHCVICWENFGSHILFSVLDNGRGMSGEELQALQKVLDTPDENGNSFAMRNIQEQLQMYFHQKIHIETALGEGTKIWFLIGKEGDRKHV